MRALYVGPLALVAAAGGIASVAAAGVQTTSAANTTSACSAPLSVTGIFDQTVSSATKGQVHQRWARPGDQVTITGQGFSQPGCSATVTIGDATAVTPSANGGTSLAFTAPALSSADPRGLDGPVTVQLTDSAGRLAASNGNYHFLEQPSAALQQSAPTEDSTETLSGLGFNTGGDPISLTATYAGCPGPGVVLEPAAAQSPTQLSTTVPGTYCDGAVTIGVTDPHYDSAQGAKDDAPITLSAPASGSVDVAPVVTSVSPRTVPAGSYVTVDGSGFGPDGSARVGGVSTPTGWSDHEIIAQAPSGVTSGTLVLRRGSGDHATFSAGSLTIVPASPDGAGSTGTSSGWSHLGVTGYVPAGALGLAPGPGGSSSPPLSLPWGAVAPNHAASNFVLSAAQRSTGNGVRISAGSSQAAVGSRVSILVTLVVDGKPVAGAPVSLAIVSAPGPDARIAPSQGVTDATGQFHARLRLSRLAGDHLLLARSGQYSDELNVLGEVKTAGASIHLPFGSINVSGNPLVVWLSVAAFILLALGVVVNVNVMRRFLWSITGGKLIALLVHRGRKRPA